MLTITNEDNMDLMSRYPDKHFDLAIVDPPYGIDHANKAGKMAGQQYGKAAAKKKDYAAKDWDKATPDIKYWQELFRVSKNQIVWGGNYFSEYLSSKSAWIVWDKDNGENNFSDCELAWSSFDKGLRMIKSTWNGMLQHNMKNKQIRIHPTEKPYRLYKFILDNYATAGDKILDTHLGSGSIAIACHDYGFDLTACELDKDYYDAAMNRINNHMKQQNLFL